MLDFTQVRKNQMTMMELVADLTRDDLGDLTNEMIDYVLDLISECEDEDVVFEPSDPDAHDPYAVNEEDVKLAWNLGHVIVHITASSEESAFLGAEMARGVEFHGRSRYELPWEEMRTIEGCQKRLEESRGMRLASLALWPEEAHSDYTHEAWPGGPIVNATARFVQGLSHADNHLRQIEEIVRQARAAREAN